ncbi:hypothetical protein C8R44DRAFT_724901 [Mycena epipterygia]|nr:hypothetical protein C8R44DRAFT_724901 [Mycena epipterygia]
MSFVSNVDHLTLGNGVYNNVHGNLVHNTFYVRKRRREEISDAPNLLSSTEPTHKRRRREENSEDGIKVIQRKHLKLNLQIGRGPGYSLHAGETEGGAVIVKVFNAGPTVREQLESTVALSTGLLHPNVLRVEGVSSEASLTHFITYENAYWKTAEGPLAAALKDDLAKSITLGFKMIAGLSAGLNHINDQDISMTSLGAELRQNFDIFLDVNDRFLISISPPVSTEAEAGDSRQLDDNATRLWHIFNALCQRVLRSANRALHTENIERTPVIPDIPRRPPDLQKSLASTSVALPETHESSSSHKLPENEPSVPPRREYVWRTIDRGQQSLATVASRIAMDLDLKLSSSVNKLAWSNGRSAHRCAGYMREEITLATTTGDSAVVSHDAPSPLEICSVCHEVVGVHEFFRCDCGDPSTGVPIARTCGTVHLNTVVPTITIIFSLLSHSQDWPRHRETCRPPPATHSIARHPYSPLHSDDIPPAPKLGNIPLPLGGREYPYEWQDLLFPNGIASKHSYPLPTSAPPSHPEFSSYDCPVAPPRVDLYWPNHQRLKMWLAPENLGGGESNNWSDRRANVEMTFASGDFTH